MDKRKRVKLRAAGWTVGTPREFLRMSDEEAAFVEFKLALSKTLQALRAAQELSQVDVAKRLQSSQSRVAKMEASDRSVSVDLLVKSLFRLGAQPGDIAKALRPRRKVAAT
jgi:Helix-turn-helix domain